MNFYEFLEVGPDADVDTINAAYRKKAMMFHPDSGGSNEQMAQLNEAWETLSNESLRRRYDECIASCDEFQVKLIQGRTECESLASGLFAGMRRIIAADFANASFRRGIRKWADWDIAGDSVSGWAFFLVGAIGGTIVMAEAVAQGWLPVDGRSILGLGLIIAGWVAGAEFAIKAHRVIAGVLLTEVSPAESVKT